MTKYSWSSYAGTKEPHMLPVASLRRGDSRCKQYGFNEGLVQQVTGDNDRTEMFEFGRSHGFYLVIEAVSEEQAGLMFRKILKEAIKAHLGFGKGGAELDLGVSHGRTGASAALPSDRRRGGGADLVRDRGHSDP